MNILEHYEQNLIHIEDPDTNDNENYYCNITYDDKPFIIQTNHICFNFKANGFSTTTCFLHSSAFLA